ncbi:hypothetical protein G210_3332 [Candida maltosa Xu316]|uniref:Uncharacterized protein n=1 Tax=Candida maltosa (strain Xu316) TaxID=1245528 RepID=M3JU74_CANMX|nr:hypothetical protein G210_3332 [Candida maltosa Xu316]
MSSSSSSLVQPCLRKSKRTRTSTEKAKIIQTNTSKVIEKEQPTQQSIPKKRKISNIEKEEYEKSDKIDPVEKLLSLTNINQDFLSDLTKNIPSNISSSNSTSCLNIQNIHNTSNNHHHNINITHNHKNSICSNHSGYEEDDEGEEFEEEIEEEEEEEEDEFVEIANVNFTKIIQDNIRQFYVNRRLQNQYHDTFSLLNQSSKPIQQTQPSTNNTTPSTTTSNNPDVPFFKSVNFGNKPREYTIDDYFSYSEATEEEQQTKEPETSETDVSPITTPKSNFQSLYIPKINSNNHYHYHYNNDNSRDLLLRNTINNNNDEQDLSKILNKNSLINGKASEMVSSGNFMINDFFL